MLKCRKQINCRAAKTRPASRPALIDYHSLGICRQSRVAAWAVELQGGDA